jgi:hypothetical protein
VSWSIAPRSTPTLLGWQRSASHFVHGVFFAARVDGPSGPWAARRGSRAARGRIRCQDAVVRRYEAVVYDSSRWEGFELRPGDIIISTPPKSGTTWTQMICALLVLQEPELPLPLDTLSPWIDMVTRARTEVFADLAAQTHRRFIKTHTPLDGIPNDPAVTYVCVGRDPRDVALSMDHHIDNMDVGGFLLARERAAAIARASVTGSGTGSTTRPRRRRRDRRCGRRSSTCRRSATPAPIWTSCSSTTTT